jgi:hypothetical protein
MATNVHVDWLLALYDKGQALSCRDYTEVARTLFPRM